MQTVFPTAAPDPTIALILEGIAYQGQNQIRRSVQRNALNYQGIGFVSQVVTIKPSEQFAVDTDVLAWSASVSGPVTLTLYPQGSDGGVDLPINKYMFYDGGVSSLTFANGGADDVQLNICYVTYVPE